MSGPLSDLFASDAEFSEDMRPASSLEGSQEDDAQSFQAAESTDESFATFDAQPGAGGYDRPSSDWLEPQAGDDAGAF